MALSRRAASRAQNGVSGAAAIATITMSSQRQKELLTPFVGTDLAQSVKICSKYITRRFLVLFCQEFFKITVPIISL